jgi:hypothetical protein
MPEPRRSPRQDLARLRAIAEPRGGVVGREDLRDCGFSTDATTRRVQDGTWQRIGAAVLLPAPWSAHHLDDIRWAWILQFTFGPAAAISGALALRRAGWHLPDESLLVVVPEKPRARLPGVRLLRRSTADHDQHIHEPRFVSAPEAFLDTIIKLPRVQRSAFIDAALQQRLVTAEDFAHWMQPRLGKGHTGATALRYALLRMSTGARSEAEQRMAVLLKRSRTGHWRPNYPLYNATGRVVAEIDFALTDLRIAIEVDGRAHHSDHRSFERDRQRQNHLALGGWLVLRFTWEQITEQPSAVMAAVAAAVSHRAA